MALRAPLSRLRLTAKVETTAVSDLSPTLIADPLTTSPPEFAQPEKKVKPTATEDAAATAAAEEKRVPGSNPYAKYERFCAWCMCDDAQRSALAADAFKQVSLVLF